MPSAPISGTAHPLEHKLGEARIRPRWHVPALVLFGCLNVAALGIFFAVFVGVIASPPQPRNVIHLLVAGSFAFAALVLGQFFYWSRMALIELKVRDQ
jgi:hypothetical protein